MTRPFPAVLAVALAVLSSGQARAEDGCERAGYLAVTGLGTWSEELARLADLAPGALAPSSGTIRRGGLTHREQCSGSPEMVWGDRFTTPSPGGLLVVPPTLRLAYQAIAPGGSNDGVLWQGRGFSTLASGGLRGAWGPLRVQLAPEVTWAQNQGFQMAETGGSGNLRFRNPWYGDALDVPQRYGDDPRARVGFGQSFLAVEGFGARLAVSTENLWWGAGIRNSLLLTNNAEGFPHLSVGTSRPLDVWVGKLEAQLVLGRLTRTKYLGDRFRPFFNGLAVSLEPRWLPGLYVGAGRTFVEDERTLRKNLYFSVFQATAQEKAGDNPHDNQIMAVWARWVMSEIELYGEYGLDDYASFSGISRVGDRAAAWVLGFQKRWVRSERWWRVQGELAKTRSNLPPGKATSFYTHGGGSDYTHDGQLLGAFIGPGADAQYLSVDAFTPSGRIGGYVERVRRNEEIYWARFADSRTVDHDVELVFGARQVILTQHLEVSWDLAAGYRYNRDFVERYRTTFRGMVTVALPFDGRPRWSGAPVAAAHAGEESKP